MFFVYAGYTDSDNYDASEGPIYELHSFASEKEIIKFKKEFDEGISDIEVSNLIFRIFEGKEKKLRSKKIEINWDIIDK